LCAPRLHWWDGEGDFDFDEWAQRCPNCRHEHVWVNVEDPDYDRWAWQMARMTLEVAARPDALELVADLEPSDPVRRNVEELHREFYVAELS